MIPLVAGAGTLINFLCSFSLLFEFRDKMFLSSLVQTRSPQNKHGPDPSCSHTTRPQLRQLLISLHQVQANK